MVNVQEAKKLKLELENEILGMLREYEEKTQANIEDISLDNTYCLGGKTNIMSVNLRVEI